MALGLIEQAEKWQDRIAIKSNKQSYTYNELLAASAAIATELLAGKEDLSEERVAFMVAPSFEYTAAQWGIWRAGGLAVPLSVLHPLASIQYVLEDTEASILLVSAKYIAQLEPLAKAKGIRLLKLEKLQKKPVRAKLPEIEKQRRAMILYTSGTTNLPKGVVTTHANIEAQIRTLVEAWAWEAEDQILNILPLHHVHGIINVMSCALWSGACCLFLPKFDAAKVWALFEQGALNLFMAVPTIYYKLIDYWEKASVERRAAMSAALRRFRLMVSGSAALPVPVLEKWREISGHTLLERYGMTEIGMGLSNPYIGERRAGHVGQPLPGVELRLLAEDGREIKEKQFAGEIQIKGPSLFLEYWRKPQATQESFMDGWFRTGDIAILNDGYYKILGRNSVDIIKSGGYKISALEIEDVLRKFSQIKDAAVVGIADPEWGEVVAASIVLQGEKPIDIEALKIWLKDQLPTYKIPRKFLIQLDLPRNALGKVTKKAVKKLFE